MEPDKTERLEQLQGTLSDDNADTTATPAVSADPQLEAGDQTSEPLTEPSGTPGAEPPIQSPEQAAGAAAGAAEETEQDEQ